MLELSYYLQFEMKLESNTIDRLPTDLARNGIGPWPNTSPAAMIPARASSTMV